MGDMSAGYGFSQWEGWPEYIGKFIPLSNTSFFHYTSLSGCLNMLSAQKDEECSYLSIWASHFLFLNDSEEYRDGLNIVVDALTEYIDSINDENHIEIIEVCKKYRETFFQIPHIFSNEYPGHYTISFCNQGNLLSQWKYYGKESGIAIEYDLHNCEFSGYTTWAENVWSEHPVYDIIYDKDRKKKVIKEAIKSLETIKTDFEYNAVGVLKQICAIISFMKSDLFREEAESRLLFAPVFDDDVPVSHSNDPMNLVKYREVDGKIKPYLTIKLRHKTNDCLPVKSLTVGPGRNQNLIFNALIMFLQSNFPIGEVNMTVQQDADGCDYVVINGVKLRTSNIPFRE